MSRPNRLVHAPISSADDSVTSLFEICSPSLGSFTTSVAAFGPQGRLVHFEARRSLRASHIFPELSPPLPVNLVFFGFFYDVGPSNET